MQHEHPDPDRREPLEVELEEHVEAPPDDVFDYIADRDRFPVHGNGAVTLGERLILEPPYRVEWEAEFTGDGGTYPGTVEVTLAPDAAGTRVRVVHRTDVQPQVLGMCAPRMMALAA
jgi:uncharacterized protein YndB with AHSA1/START domain